jgi:hypothetical protein
MLKKYFLWVGLSMLGLVNCTRSERTPATAGAPGAPALANPAAPTARDAQPPAATPAAPAATLPPPPAPESAEATRLLALLDGPRRHRSTTLAAAPPDTLAEATADSTRATELREYLLASLPPPQVFTIRPSRDTMLVGAQGTQLLVRAADWDLPAGAPVVQLTLQEFYTPTDMVLAGLSTRSGSDLLETGGMLKLTATAQGQPVRLRPGGRVYLRMPARKVQPDMRLYEGQPQGPAQHIDWQLPAPQPATTAWPVAATRPATAADGKGPRRQRRRRHPMTWQDSLAIKRPAPHWPHYADFNAELRKQCQPSGPGATSRLHRSRGITNEERAALNRLSQVYKERIVRQVALRFLVDSAGVLHNVEVLPTSDSEYAAAVVRALRQVDRWQPATLPFFKKTELHTEPAAAEGTLSVAITKSGQPYSSLSWRWPRAGRPRVLALRHRLDSLLASPRFLRRYHRVADSLAAVRRAAEGSSSGWAQMRAQFADSSRAAITKTGVYYELAAQGFSWINCDRFLALSSIIKYQVRDYTGDAVVMMMFKRFAGVLQSDAEAGGTVSFNRVPSDQPATVVALRRAKGILYLAIEPVVLTEAPLTSLRYRPVSMAQLRATLDGL